MNKELSSVARRASMAAIWLFAGLGMGQSALAQTDGEPEVALGGGRGVQGTVTSVAADHLTLRTERGETYQVAVSPNTRVMKSRTQIKLGEVHAGDGIASVGELDLPNKTVHALFLMVIDAEQLKKAREALGKTWVSGTVTAIDQTRITVLRPDQVSQVISVDEDTSFRRGGRAMPMGFGEGGPAPGRGGRTENPASDAGESVTLADVKVGNLVTGPGSLKNGIFVPTTLGISDAAAGRGRRRQGGGANSASPPSPATEGKGR